MLAFREIRRVESALSASARTFYNGEPVGPGPSLSSTTSLVPLLLGGTHDVLRDGVGQGSLRAAVAFYTPTSPHLSRLWMPYKRSKAFEKMYTNVLYILLSKGRAVWRWYTRDTDNRGHKRVFLSLRVSSLP